MSDFATVKDLLEKQGEAWEEFKRKNDERLNAIEKKGYAPADLTETVEKLNAELNKIGAELKAEQSRLDEFEKLANRPGVGADDLSPDQREHAKAFKTFLRQGKDSGLGDIERKAMGRGSDPDGGYLVPVELDAMIDRVAATIGSLRRLATVRTSGVAGYKKRVKTSGMSARWVGESEAGGETTEPKYAMIEILPEKMEVEPWVYNDTLEDVESDLEADLTEEAGIGFAEGEAAAFISGTGVKQPRGILSYTIVANASYAWGKVGYIASGGAGAWAASNPADKIIDLQHALKQQYRNGAVFLMADSTLASVRQLKDGSGNYYLWQPDPSANFSGRILGSPVEIDDNMPAIAANSYSIAFANFRRAYTVVDRRGTSLIRDNITTKGTTKFNFTRRVGGGISHFEAIKLMKFATS
jgi:HK97 family phage major capsid protein